MVAGKRGRKRFCYCFLAERALHAGDQLRGIVELAAEFFAIKPVEVRRDSGHHQRAESQQNDGRPGGEQQRQAGRQREAREHQSEPSST